MFKTPNSDQSELRRVHIVSWNVASWSTTLGQIRAQHGSLRAWADRHFVDILCLQEVKGTVSKLEREPAVYAANENGFDSFFSMCRSAVNNNSAASKVGFNGVATFARKGLTLSANTRPLGLPDLDLQGRCIETHHGEFVLFNIYAPYDGNGSDSLETKMKFLTRLREGMRRCRAETGKPVILVGDFNARYRLMDSSPEMRVLDVRRFLNTEPVPDEPSIAKELRAALGNGGLNKIKASINKIVTQPFGDRGKFRVFAPHPVSGELKRINAANTLWTKEQVDSYRPFAANIVDGNVSPKETFGFCDYVHSNGTLVSEIGERDGDVRWVARMEDCAFLEDIRVLTRELLDVEWTESSFTEFANYEKGDWLISGKICTSAWIESLLKEDHMIDTFAHVNPNAAGRYTVWCQQTNDRFANFGSRIDFVFVDDHPKIRLPANDIPLYGCTCRSKEECASKQFRCADSEQCAKNAATSYGRWKPAPFAGGGLPLGTKNDYETQFLRKPHTGLIYTPPQFSDHIATSCVLEGLSEEFFARNYQISKDQETSSSRPFAKQSSILGFFQVKRQKSDDESGTGPST